MKTLSTQEVADHFEVSRQTVYNWITSGKLAAIRIGGKLRVTQEAVDSFAKPTGPVDKTGLDDPSSRP